MQKNNLPGRYKIPWLVSILVEEDKRDRILDKLKENGIDARRFFIPLGEMNIYKKYAKDCTNSKRISRMGINLPTTYDIRDKDIEKIVELLEHV